MDNNPIKICAVIDLISTIVLKPRLIEKKISKIEDEIVSSNSDISKLDNEHNILKNSLKSIKTHITSLDKKTKSFNSKIFELDTEHDMLKKKVALLKRLLKKNEESKQRVELEKHQNEITELLEKKRTLKTQITNNKNEHSKSLSEIDKVKIDSGVISKKKSSLKRSIKNKEKSIETQKEILKTTLCDYECELHTNFNEWDEKKYYYKYLNSKPSFKSMCKRIYNDTENHYYSYNDLLITYAYYAMFEVEPIYEKVLTYNSVKKVKEMFRAGQLKKDIKFVKNLKEELEIEKYWEFFEVDDIGESKVYNLVKNDFISVVFFIHFYCEKCKKQLTDTPKNCKLYVNNEYLFFKRLNIIIFKIFKRKK
tara:strand:- start:1458 stop:2555 length:1098 start_codon:yes stop_codon:yes gene_type:complete